MPTLTAEIKSQILSLPIGERADLAHDLILSLEKPDDFAYDPQYEAEIRRRIDSVFNGTAKGLPADEALDRIEARFR